MTRAVRQTSAYLRAIGLPVTCIEFSYFKTAAGEELLTTEMVVGGEPVGGRPTSEPGQQMSRTKFLESVGVGKGLFEAILELSRGEHLPLVWGTKGFSISAALDGARVVLAYGYPPHVPAPSCAWSSLYTDRHSLTTKVAGGGALADDLLARLEKDTLWRPATNEMKCLADHEFTAAEIERVTTFILELRDRVVAHGPNDVSQGQAETLEASMARGK